MSQLIFRVSYPQSFAAGFACPVPPEVALDVDPAALAPEDRALIAERLDGAGHVRQRDEKSGEIIDYRSPRLVSSATPTIEGLLSAIRAEDEAARTYSSRAAAAEAARAEKERAESLAAIEAPYRATVRGWRLIDSYGRIIDRDHFDGDKRQPAEIAAQMCRLAAVRTEYEKVWQQYLPSEEVRASAAAQTARAAHDAETEANRAAAFAVADVELQAAFSSCAAWIAAHGSPRLKRLVAEQIDHLKTYRRERQAYEDGLLDTSLVEARPGWQFASSDELDPDVADVSSRSLALLDAARQIAADARLARRKADGKMICYARFAGRTIVWPRD